MIPVYFPLDYPIVYTSCVTIKVVKYKITEVKGIHGNEFILTKKKVRDFTPYLFLHTSLTKEDRLNPKIYGTDLSNIFLYHNPERKKLHIKSSVILILRINLLEMKQYLRDTSHST